MTTPWRWSDAWFFEAVAWAATSEAADLTAVIAAGDAINHTVLRPAEIEGAVRRLATAGLIEVFAKRFTLTARGQSLRRPAESRGVHERINWLETQFRRLQPTRDAPPYGLTEGEYQAACDAQGGPHWSAYRRHSPRP